MLLECKDFVAFHEGVNLMKRYFDPKTKVTYEEPFNKEAKPLTLKEMIEQSHLLVLEMKKMHDTISQHPDWVGNVDDIQSKTASFDVEVLTPMMAKEPELVQVIRKERVVETAPMAVPKAFRDWRKQEGKDSVNPIVDYRVYLQSDTYKDYFNKQHNDGKLTELMNEAYKSQA
jgi:hypothetical protein